MTVGNPVYDLNEARKILDYDPKTGIFKWKVNRKGNAKAGSPAGWCRKDGYIALGVRGKEYLAHRLAWAFQFNFIPENMQIDHVNGNRSDNRIKNLRLASHAENCRNSKVRKHSKTGIKGVQKRGNKWHVRIRFNKQEKWVGSYNSPEEASAAYERAAIELFGQFAKIDAA